MVEITKIPLSDILADNSFNCRDNISNANLRELAASIQETGGLLQPVVIRKLPDSKKFLHKDKSWHLVAGYRRFHACQLLAKDDPKFSVIPVTIHECTDQEAFTFNLTENLQRAELNIKEEASAVRKMLSQGMTRNEVAQKLGKSMGWLTIRLQMMDLPDDIQSTIVEYKFTNTMITQIHGLNTEDAQYEAVRKVKDKRIRGEKIKQAVEIKRDPDKRIIPKEQDRIEMMERLADIIGYGFHTRLIAWVNGNITDNELISDAYAFKRKVLDANVQV